jgi:putative hydrolase of HD superfamily
MDEVNRLRKLYELKKIYRKAFVGDRHESSAEHSWSCLILADYFLEKMDLGIDKLKVFELLIYHDVVEIEAGDVPIHFEKERKEKEKKELEAMHKLKKLIPKELGGKFESLFVEFEERKSLESRFAKAIDGLDALIHELDYKDDWKGWDEVMVRKFYEHMFLEFPEIHDVFERIVKFVKENGYFGQ